MQRISRSYGGSGGMPRARISFLSADWNCGGVRDNPAVYYPFICTCLYVAVYCPCRPAAADNFISFTHVDCSSRLMEADVTPATLTLEECSNEFVFSSCESTVYLECSKLALQNYCLDTHF